VTNAAHDHDEDGDCVVVVQPPQCYRVNPWDIASVTFYTVSGLLNALFQGAHMLGREFESHARWRRAAADHKAAYRAQQAQREAWEAHQAQMAAALQSSLVDIPTVEHPEGR
jgi:hypothetical protein